MSELCRQTFVHTYSFTAGIVHFSQFFVFMEEAEHEFWRSLGVSVKDADGSGNLSWPRVAASCNYLKPAKFEQLLQVHVQVKKVGRASVAFAFQFHHQQLKIAEGEMTVVCCRIEPGHPPAPEAIPDSLRRQLVERQAHDNPKTDVKR